MRDHNIYILPTWIWSKLIIQIRRNIFLCQLTIYMYRYSIFIRLVPISYFFKLWNFCEWPSASNIPNLYSNSYSTTSTNKIVKFRFSPTVKWYDATLQRTFWSIQIKHVRTLSHLTLFNYVYLLPLTRSWRNTTAGRWTNYRFFSDSISVELIICF